MQKIYQKNWKIKNPEKVNEKKKIQYHKHREKIRERQNNYARTEVAKKKRRQRLREKWEPGTIVYYQDLKYKIL